MANILNTEEVTNTKVVDKLVEPNSRRIANNDEPIDMPNFPRQIFMNCPELCGRKDSFHHKPLVPQAGSARTYGIAQLLTIGRQVAYRLLDRRFEHEQLWSRYLLVERLRAAGIYHNRLGKPCDNFCETERRARGDTDPGKPNSPMG
ncbi:uncharacterized protein LOC27206373 [Drosophila simulans]|uniref:uncharacterized protein LOC27206373 n=1 Tax=Drosophila simulans TaxID=7240 RepID=UPI00078AEFCD|nr:uncharacterized protein LOC27206373 [Drosophila simulans]KMZ07550.1 uncharacterized protein Dsimw501_GD16463 [Drosophila simulans]